MKKEFYFLVKRCIDIIAALLGILIMIPLAVIIKITYLINKDTSSIFFTQKRIGKDGKEFDFYKFRSMVQDADKKLEELLEIDSKLREEWEKYHKLDNDPRITKLGQFIRKTSLDEVPQFINVLKGDMSLIGPRPLVKGELDAHNGNHELYESVRPGISGWWAANGRSELDYDQRLALEYFYCENCSIMLDIKCIFRTIKSVILKKGAV